MDQNQWIAFQWSNKMSDLTVSQNQTLVTLSPGVSQTFGPNLKSLWFTSAELLSTKPWTGVRVRAPIRSLHPGAVGVATG